MSYGATVGASAANSNLKKSNELCISVKIKNNNKKQHYAHCGNPCRNADLKKNLQCDTRTFHNETRDKPDT